MLYYKYSAILPNFVAIAANKIHPYHHFSEYFCIFANIMRQYGVEHGLSPKFIGA